MGREIRKAFIAEKDFYLVSLIIRGGVRIAASLAQDKK